MSVTQSSSTASAASVLEMKSGSVTLPVLKFLLADLDAVQRELSNTIQQAPDFFHNAPIILDLQQVADADAGFDLTLLLGLLRSQNLMPVGVRGGSDSQVEAAHALDLAVFSEGGEKPVAPQRAVRSSGIQQETSRLVNHPVRSGQRVYASGGDLIVMASVSPGAELMADGNIHVYGTLRGRALAGVKGNLDARIFCSNLDAELVSVSGNYRISENIDQSIRGKSVQIYLEGESLLIEAL